MPARRTVVATYDFVQYALATFASVQEVREAFASGELTLSEPYSSIPNLQTFFATPYHFVLRDASRDQVHAMSNPCVRPLAKSLHAGCWCWQLVA